MRVHVSRAQEQVSERLSFLDDGILSFKPHDTGIFRRGIGNKVL